jgi:hypothetical protein
MKHQALVAVRPRYPHDRAVVCPAGIFLYVRLHARILNKDIGVCPDIWYNTRALIACERTT